MPAPDSAPSALHTVALPTVRSTVEREHHAGLYGGVQLTGHIIEQASPTTSSPRRSSRWRAALFRNHVLAVAVLHEQQQISEAQIGDDLPVGNEMVQPFAVVVVEIGGVLREYVKISHVSIIRR